MGSYTTKNSPAQAARHFSQLQMTNHHEAYVIVIVIFDQGTES